MRRARLEAPRSFKSQVSKLRTTRHVARVLEDAVEVAGLVTVESMFSPEETMNRLELAVREHGMTSFARIDHAAGAMQVGLPLRPTELLIFGAARAGTPLMETRQTIGIDLPLKALIWQDAANKTWVSYNDPAWLVSRHLGTSDAPAARQIAAAIDTVVRSATR
jgi:uncharacterized protein (DUF302 family)